MPLEPHLDPKVVPNLEYHLGPPEGDLVPAGETLQRLPNYDPVAKALHWLIAFAIIGMLAIGWIMTSMANTSSKFQLFQLHKSVGITILLLALFRLLWRFRHTPPPLPKHMRLWERFSASSVHWLLYALMIGMPFLGWIMVSASPMNLPTILYGLVPWPNLPVLASLPNKGHIGHVASRLHGLLAWVLAILIALHAAAACKHHLFNKDGVLLQMAPRFLHPFLNWIRGTLK